MMLLQSVTHQRRQKSEFSLQDSRTFWLLDYSRNSTNNHLSQRINNPHVDCCYIVITCLQRPPLYNGHFLVSLRCPLWRGPTVTTHALPLSNRRILGATILVTNLETLVWFSPPQCWFGIAVISVLQNTRGSTLGKERGTFEWVQRCQEWM